MKVSSHLYFYVWGDYGLVNWPAQSTCICRVFNSIKYIKNAIRFERESPIDSN